MFPLEGTRTRSGFSNVDSRDAMPPLTTEEREIVEALAPGTLQAPPNRTTMVKAHREYAVATFRTDRQPPPERTATPEPE